MLILMAKIVPAGQQPPTVYDSNVRFASVSLADGRTLWVRVEEVEAAFEIERKGT